MAYSLFMIALLAAAKLILVCASNLEAEYDHSAWLEPNEIYKLHWSVNHADKSIKFAAEVKTTGWIGFGISKGLTGNMIGADIAIGWVDSAGKGFVKDFNGTGNQRPVEDPQQDYTLTGSSQNSSWTVLKFKRFLRTCDKIDNDILEGTTKVIFAWHPSDPAGNAFSALSYHNSNRGSRSINLLNYVKNSKVPAGVPYFDFLQKNIAVPTDVTTYWCTVFKLSDFIPMNSTKHIIEIAPVIQKRMEGLVHHLVLYTCKDKFDPAHLNYSGRCYGQGMPRSIRECAGGSSMFAWAIGGVNFKFPNDVGFPIGGENSIKHFLLETHFDNPAKRSDFVDTSGLRFYYANRRKYDAAVLTTGSSVSARLLVPPNLSRWDIEGFCPKECSEKIGGNNIAPFGNSVRIFASFPHSHTVGKAITTTLIRNGTAIADVIKNDNYDFDYQQTYLLNQEINFHACDHRNDRVYWRSAVGNGDHVHLMRGSGCRKFAIHEACHHLDVVNINVHKGDELKTSCIYDSRKRSTATVGGLATDDEMCLNFIFYYPSANFTKCSTENAAIYAYTAKYANPTWYPGMNRSAKPETWQLTNWTGVTWNSSMVDELKASYASAATQPALVVSCLGYKNFRYDMSSYIKAPSITKNLQPARDECLDRTTTNRPTRPTSSRPATTTNKRINSPGSGTSITPVIALLASMPFFIKLLA